MSLLHALLRAIFDAALAPFRGLHPLVGLTVVALPISIGMLLIFKRTSAQDRLEAVKRRIHAGLFEIRLLNDDLRAIMRSLLDILRANLTYMRLSLLPMLWMIPPLWFVFAQLQFHYGYGGLAPGQQALLEVDLAPAAVTAARPSAALEAPDGLRIETPPVWIPSRNQLAWRLAAERGGEYAVTVRVGDTAETKTVRVAEGVVRRSPLRVGGNLFDQLLYPAEAPLPGDSAIRSISLSYPECDVDVLGWALPWWFWFFALTLVFGFALRGPLGVTI
jgi:uncharacterized membrane protein (DUF106 family)